MKRKLLLVLLFQVLSVLLFVFFLNSVRGEYKESLLQQGREMGRSELVKQLKEKGMTLSEDLSRLPDKRVMLKAEGYQVSQNMIFITPFAILQILTALLIIRLWLRTPSSKANASSKQ